MGYGQYSYSGTHENKSQAIKATKDGKRMKHVYQDIKEIAHLWFHEAQTSARNSQGNFYFEGATIYSYGSHFPIARIIRNAKGQKAVLLTARKYSNTTAKHVSAVNSAIRRWDANVPNPDHTESTWGTGAWVETDARIFNVVRPDLDPVGKYNWNDKTTLDHLAEDIKAAAEAVAKPRIRPETKARAWASLLKLVADANAFCQFFGIRKRFKTPADMDKLTETLKAAAAKAAKANKLARQKAEEKRIARTKEERLKYETALPLWLAGEIARLPHNPDRETSAYLRIMPAGPNPEHEAEVQTTQGACFPLAHAVRAIRMIRRLKQSRIETPFVLPDVPLFVRNGHSIHLGHYQIDQVDMDGTIKAGCHVVSGEEFERFARVVDVYLSIVAASDLANSLETEDGQ